jgi:hypothetical protein
MSDLVTGLAHAVAGAAAGWLALGVVLHLANQVARGRGWWAILREALGEDARLRPRDAISAWIAGAGAGGVVSARVGDALRVLLLSRRLPDAGAAVLAGTLVAEAAGELAGGVVVLAVAVAAGAGAPLGAPAWALAAALPPGLAIGWALRRRNARTRRAPRPDVPTAGAAVVAHCERASRARLAVRRVAAGVRQGCAPLAHPRAYARRVAPWQLASRCCRIAAMGCFLAAFHLPATPVAVLLVFIAQGSGRLVPFSPAAVGAGVAVLAATFEPVTGTAVPYGRLAAFLIGTSSVLTAIGVVLAAVITVRGIGLRALPARLRRAATAPAR